MNSNDTVKKRINYIDFIKGVAIFLVVVGHCVSRQMILEIIYMFHMPLFFMLSGYLLRPTDYSSMRDLVSYKAKKLLYPYFSFGIIIICYLSLKSVAYDNFSSVDIEKRMLALLYGHHIWISESNTAYLGTLWFLVALFCSEILASLFLREKNRYKRIVIASSIGMIAFITSFPIVSNSIRLPWCFDISCTAMLFILAGYWLKMKGNLSGYFVGGVLLIFGFAVGFANKYLCTVFFFSFERVDMLELRYGIWPLFLISATAISFGIIIISKQIYKKINFPLIEKAGKLSLLIMVTHLYIRDDIRWIIGNYNYSNLVLTTATFALSIVLSLIIERYIRWVYDYNVLKKMISHM